MEQVGLCLSENGVMDLIIPFTVRVLFFVFFFKKFTFFYLFIYLFIYDCAESSFLCEGFL